MTKTIVGLYDNIDQAQQAVQNLIDNGFRREDISVVAHDKNRERIVGEHEEHATGEGAGAGALGGGVLGGALGLLVGAGLLAIPGIGPVLAAGPLSAAIGTAAATIGAGVVGAGIGAATGGLIGGLVGAGVPKEEAEYYAEGVRRGGTLVTVSAADDRTQLAVDLMERNGAVDIDQRVAEWRSSGWTGFVETEPVETATDTTMRDRTAIRGDEEAVLPVVEEQIDVGKRPVDQGGVRVNTHVEERPVEEQVRLRDERVNVERRPADRPVTDADVTAFKEASFEVRETTEEPVVRKRARVVEEVIIDKEFTERTETIRDSVRRTDVSVDQIGAESTGSGSEMAGYSQYDNDYRTHYQSTYGTSGYTYDDYMPIYRFGHSLATNQRYQGRDWSAIEPEARTHWESQNPGTWDRYKSTVQYAWDKARGRR
jgi:uncharacterized protein (TIGR02271 family)